MMIFICYTFLLLSLAFALDQRQDQLVAGLDLEAGHRQEQRPLSQQAKNQLAGVGREVRDILTDQVLVDRRAGVKDVGVDKPGGLLLVSPAILRRNAWTVRSVEQMVFRLNSSNTSRLNGLKIRVMILGTLKISWAIWATMMLTLSFCVTAHRHVGRLDACLPQDIPVDRHAGDLDAVDVVRLLDQRGCHCRR